MRVDHNWLVPRFGGEYYSEKPPFYFWILIMSQSLLGKTTVSMVLPSMISAILCVLLIYLFGIRIIKEHYAFLAGLILATCGLFFGLAIFLRMDMLLTTLATAASIAFYQGYRQDDQKVQGRWYYSFYILMAMAILIKGPTGFLMPFVTAIVFLALQGKWSEFKKIKLLQGLGIVFGVIALWALALILTGQQAYAYHLFVLQTLGRAVNSFAHKEPIYFYLKEFPLSFLPWTIFLISSLWYAVRQRKKLTDVDRYLLCWLVAPFILMSLFSGKIVIYLLPIFPPGALLVARLFERVGEKEASPSYVVIPSIITWLLLMVIIFVLPKEIQGIPLRSLMKPAFVPYVALGLLAVFGLVRKKFQWMPIVIAGMFSIFLSVLMWNVLPGVSAGYTKRPMAMELKRLHEQGIRHIVAYRYYQPESMGYYTGFIVKGIPDRALAGYLRTYRDAVVLSDEDNLNQLQSQYKMEKVYGVNGDILVKQRP
jgi:4-amino-4-deoxy-L-arabinose transferase-like glycosyltransferase